MPRMIVLIALLCLADNVRADQDTWLRSENPENSSFLTPKLKISTLNDSLVFWPGIGIGWILGSVVSIGFEGYVLASEMPAETVEGSAFSMAVVGMTFEAVTFPERRTHLSYSLLVGGGGAQAGGAINLDTLTRNSFFIIEPGVSLEFNLTRNIRLGPGLSYLWISGDVAGITSKWKIAETAFNVKFKFKEPD